MTSFRDSGKSVISQTYVTYHSGDAFGYILGHCTLIPIYLLAMYITLIITRRDFHTLFSFFGQILCLFANKILKDMIDEPRPVDSELNDSGMPSNHSQFMMFFAVYYSFQLLFRTTSIRYLSLIERCLYAKLLLSMACLVCYSRVYLSNHTTEQVLVGFVVGAVIGIIWFLFDVLYGYRIGNFLCKNIPFVRWMGVCNFNPLEQYFQIRLQQQGVVNEVGSAKTE